MKIIKEVKISYWAHHITTIVSVTLVLVLLGIIALVWRAADGETRRIQEQVELSIIMTDSVAPQRTQELAASLKSMPYSASVEITDKAAAMARWKEDTGENLEEIFGVNPLSDEISVTLTPEYADNAKIASLVKQLEVLPNVDAVAAPDSSMVQAMNSNISALMTILAIVAAVMLLISFVLINNTVHLSIYSRRFTIHTMQLVGATDGFIRRPIILDNVLAGLMAGVFASILLFAGLHFGGNGLHINMEQKIGIETIAIIFAALIILSMILCALASGLACSRYLHKDYDKLFS